MNCGKVQEKREEEAVNQRVEGGGGQNVWGGNDEEPLADQGEPDQNIN